VYDCREPAPSRKSDKTDTFAGTKTGTQPIFFGSGTIFHYIVFIHVSFLKARFREVGKPRKSQLVSDAPESSL
jgi:hypothetical protein